MISINWFLDYYKDFLKNHLRYAFPTSKAGDIDELKDFLISEKYSVFSIDSSCGLNGFVIAKNISVYTKNYE